MKLYQTLIAFLSAFTVMTIMLYMMEENKKEFKSLPDTIHNLKKGDTLIISGPEKGTYIEVYYKK